MLSGTTRWNAVSFWPRVRTRARVLFAPHYGVDHNTVAENVSADNGVQIGGSGVGLFSDGNGPGRTSDNLIIHNKLTGNGLGGVALHTHVGPAFGAPADNMDGNMIIGNFIAGNLADQADTATPGRVGININSGGGGSPVVGTVITGNVIRDEDVDIAVNTPAEVDTHLNELLGGKIGVADVCAFDHAAPLHRQHRRHAELLGLSCRPREQALRERQRVRHSLHPLAARADRRGQRSRSRRALRPHTRDCP